MSTSSTPPVHPTPSTPQHHHPVEDIFPGHRYGIVSALDLPTSAAVRDVVAATTGVDGVVAYKLGHSTVLELGLRGAVDLIRQASDLPIIYDHQKAGLDVPSNARHFADLLAGTGVAGAIIFPLAGPQTAREYLSRLRERGIVPLVGGLLPIDDYTISTGGWVADDVLTEITRLALAHGETNIIAPANSALNTVIAAAGISPTLFVPGIGAGGTGLDRLGDVVDQVSGIFPIVGRAIVTAADPAQAATDLAAALTTVVAGAPQ